MRRLVFSMLLFLVVAAPAGAKTMIATAALNGGQETPPNTSKAFGVGFFTLDSGTKMLCYSITTTQVEDTESAAHFHGPALPGQSADVIFAIPQTGRVKNGCVGPLSKDQQKAFKKGLLYANIHSMPDFPNGEIRGQLVPRP